MIFDISINEFNRQFQLCQKGERYNLNLYDLDYNYFLFIFFEDLIEDFEVSFGQKDSNFIQTKQSNKTTIHHFFEDQDYLKAVTVYSAEGYFFDLDLYFRCTNDLIEINFIKREILFSIVDRLLANLDCNYKSRLKTELLLNMEFE